MKKMLFYIALKLLKFKCTSNEKLNKPFGIQKLRKIATIGNKFIFLLQPIRNDVKIIPDTLGPIASYYFIPSINYHKTILYLHGGGYILDLNHTKNLYFSFCAELSANCKAQVWLIDYKTAPEYSMTDIINDAYQAYLELIAKGISTQNIFVMGDSAGGGLVLNLLMTLKSNVIPLPKALVLLSPWSNMSTNSGSMITHEKDDPILTPYLVAQIASVIRSTSSKTTFFLDYHNIPPLMILIGGHEILFDDGYDIAENARKSKANVILDINENMFHAYPLFSHIFHEGKEAIARIASFVA